MTAPYDAKDVGDSFDYLRILTGPICERCWNCDGEIVPATHRTAPYYGPSEDECQQCYDREPGDMGEDDGPLTMAQWDELSARDAWRLR